jgi:lipopolysaccharide biosynthesis regulator YciM
MNARSGYAEAETVLKEAIQVNPKEARGYISLGVVQAGQGDHAAAAENNQDGFAL